MNALRRSFPSLVAVATIIPLLLGALCLSSFGGDKGEVHAADDKELIKITKKRIPMDPRLLTLCVGPGAVVGPHDAAEVDIYVNPVVAEYRRKNPTAFAYPIGSKFVKKKYPRVGAKDPDIATVMLKTAETGKVTDWEFSMVRLKDGKRLTHSGSVSCADCHERYKSRGYISRESEEAMQQFLADLKTDE